MSNSPTILCLASYFKGNEFMQECKRQGCKVILLTNEKILDADWPRDSLDEVHGMPDLYEYEEVISGVSYLARSRSIDRIVALDDFDVETAARLREHLRIPGMGDTTTRYFRDKLAMRKKAKESGIKVPEFIHVLNYDRLREFIERVPAPWVLKPRSQASAVGIKKIKSAEELWHTLDVLGDQQSFNLLEQFIRGSVYHVDSLISNKTILFTAMNKYTHPPLSVAHEGGIFATCTLKRNSSERAGLRDLNKKVIRHFGLVKGTTHTEFIQGDDGEFYFLETAARVGGAHIPELVEAESGINLWREWAKLEIADDKKPYLLPKVQQSHAGLIISLARQEKPDTREYNNPEIVWRLDKKHHVGFILKSKDWNRINSLIENYRERIKQDFHAALPAPEKASH